MKRFSSLLRVEGKLFCMPLSLFVNFAAVVILICTLVFVTYSFFPAQKSVVSAEEIRQNYAAELESIREQLAIVEDPSLAQGPLPSEAEIEGLLVREKMLTFYLENDETGNSYLAIDDEPADVDAIFNDKASCAGALSAHKIVVLAFAVICAIKGIARMCDVLGKYAKTRLLCDRSRRETIAAAFAWDAAVSGILAIAVAVLSSILSAVDGIKGFILTKSDDIAVIGVHETVFFQLIAMLALGAAAYMSCCLCASLCSKLRGFVGVVAAIVFWGACVGVGVAFDYVVEDGLYVLLDLPMIGVAFSLAEARSATYWIHLALCAATAALCGYGAVKRYLKASIK